VRSSLRSVPGAAGATLIAATLLAACRPANPIMSAAVADSTLIGRDVRYLAGDSLEGRRTGTPGNDSAAAWITRRLSQLGLEPAIAGACASSANGGGCDASFGQPFTARPAAAAHAGIPADLATANVAGIIRGRDPALRNQYVIVGAHFDHLGRSTFGALDPQNRDEIRNGADDNASGTAAVLELARLLKRRPPARSVLVVLFSGEEYGLLGSQYFVEHSPVPLDSVQAMLNFDMVGRLRDDKLIVYGVATATELPGVVNAANVAPVFRVSAVGDGFGPSDHSSFYARNLPVLHFFTDLHDDYHRASDDAAKINAGGIARIAAYAERITRDLADRPQRLTFVRAPVTASSQASSRTGSQAYLGTIPDMGAGDGTGLRLSGVRAGSPADSAGLRDGDVIVELGGVSVKDLYTYSDALYARQPGETIAIVYRREGQRLTTKATLGRRGG
jgi:hypothetical protein